MGFACLVLATFLLLRAHFFLACLVLLFFVLTG